MFEEQGLVKPKTPKPRQKHRPKCVFREESSSDTFSKCSSTRKTLPPPFDLLAEGGFLLPSPLFAADNLSNAQSGSSLSLASAATNEADSVNSGGAGSQR